MTASFTERKREIAASFRRQFGCEPELIARAPGRVNLIGEHTDYNEGFVLPMAIDREVLIAADRQLPEGRIELYSAEYNQLDSFSLANLQHSAADQQWSNYLKGVVACLVQRGYKLPSFRAAVSGNVPQGAGLSSSAALEVATATLLNSLGSYGLDGRGIALLAQSAENDFVGVKCGIMDQFVSALAQPDAALLIDCRDLSFQSIPLPLSSQSLAIVITHSGVSRGLLDSKFNERRSECDEGMRLLKLSSGGAGLVSLRDVDAEMLLKYADLLPETTLKRVRHVVRENERVQQAAAFLRQADMKGFGRLMIESHNSLKDDYEVSCAELDKLVELSLAAPGCLGARMTGAGFGGCTVALFLQEHLPSFLEDVLLQYQKITGRTASAYVCRAVGGANIV